MSQAMLSPQGTYRLVRQTWTAAATAVATASSRAKRSSIGCISRRWQHAGCTTINPPVGRSGASNGNGPIGGRAPPTSDQPSSGSGSGRTFRTGLLFILFGLGCGSAGAYASWHTLRSRGLGFYSDEESLQRFTPDEGDALARSIQDTIDSHPMVTALRQRPELTESRPHLKMPAQYRAQSLTGGTLTGPGKVPVPAYAWTESGGRSLVSVVFVGEKLCGHPGIVHGGFLATMLDEGLARCCFGALPHNIGVTANLNIDYRKPTPAGTFLVLRAETTKVEGRKAWVKGRIESLVGPGETPTVYAEATALFVSPKFAAMLPKMT
ncbi:hypothetical protein E4U28_006459 [Claviceps purpurea]|nr:hypothetical protein E4U28_006459 [Claviceps purpurea]